jgi:hypothetical protein
VPQAGFELTASTSKRSRPTPQTARPLVPSGGNGSRQYNVNKFPRECVLKWTEIRRTGFRTIRPSVAGVEILSPNTTDKDKQQARNISSWQAVLWLRWLVACISPRSPEFAPGLVRVGFVDSGTGTESLCVIRFSFVSIIPQGLHTHILGVNKRPFGGCSSETQSLPSDMNHNVIARVENAGRYRTRG